MGDYRSTETTTPVQPATHTTTIVERRGGGGGILIGLAVLILVAIGAYFLFTQTENDKARTNAVTGAAESVGDAAKDVGDAAKKAVE